MNVAHTHLAQRLVLTIGQTDEGIDGATTTARVVQHQPVARHSPVANLQRLVVVTHMLGRLGVGISEDGVYSVDETLRPLQHRSSTVEDGGDG